MKPLIIGEAPSKNEFTPRPIEGRIGKRLAQLCGLSLSEFLNHFDRINLLHERQDNAEHGFTFDMEAAKGEAEALLKMTSHNEPVVILLGLRVAQAFYAQKDYFTQQSIGGMRDVRVIPHPSGVNRWWNDPQNYAHAERFMRNIVARTRR